MWVSPTTEIPAQIYFHKSAYKKYAISGMTQYGEITSFGETIDIFWLLMDLFLDILEGDYYMGWVAK